MKNLQFYRTLLSAIAVSMMIPHSFILGKDTEKNEDFECNLVIGYSQVNQWYKGFESALDDDRWELLWNGGAGVDKWSDPNYSGWKNEIVSSCKQRSGDPDRVVLSVSGIYGDDVDMWSQKIRETIGIIRSKYKNVRRIVLQPVVGGHDHHACPAPAEKKEVSQPGGHGSKKSGQSPGSTGGSPSGTSRGRGSPAGQGGTAKCGGATRAAYQHPFIDEAIGCVVSEDKTGLVVAGPSPEVRSCEDYADGLGHLTQTAGSPIGQTIAEFYHQDKLHSINKN